MLRSRQRSQSVVEFGLVAMLFTLLMFAVVDFGLLLNSWIALSSGTREVARLASIGETRAGLFNMLNALALAGISRTPYPPFSEYCCGDLGLHAKVVLTVVYYPGCMPGVSGCSALDPTLVDSTYWGGQCPSGCAHPARGDIVVVSVSAPGMEVVTPLVRPFFGCASDQPHCNVPLSTSATMRYEGQ